MILMSIVNAFEDIAKRAIIMSRVQLTPTSSTPQISVVSGLRLIPSLRLVVQPNRRSWNTLFPERYRISNNQPKMTREHTVMKRSTT